MKYTIIIAIIVSYVALSEAQNTNVTVVMPYAQSFTLNCLIANPTWYFVNKTSNAVSQISTGGKFTVNGNNLTITDLRTGELNAEYICNATGASTTFYPNPQPYMYSREKSSITVTEGGFTTVSCKMIVGYQQNQAISWVWKLKGTELTGDRVEVKNSGTNNQTSELTLRKITLEDKGAITCTVVNSAGNYTQEITLRVKNTLAALWPFLAIVGEVIILCIIILIFEKKCTKKSTTSEDEAENLMKQKDNNNSDLKKRSVKA